MPPSKETLATLQAADGGRYGRSACLQALLENNGDEELSLKTLRLGASIGEPTAGLCHAYISRHL